MASIKQVVTGCVALVPMLLLAPAGRTAAPAVAFAAEAAQCDSPSFAVPQGSPFSVTGAPRGLANGTFFRRSGAQSGCRCDLAIAVAVGDSSSPDSIVIMRGADDGTFAQAPELPSVQVDENPSLLAVGRFNAGAGDLDSVVVVSGATARGTVTILNPNQSTGRYEKPASEPRSWPTGDRPTAITTGDFNADGSLDVAIANRDRSLTLLIGNGSGSFLRDPVVVTGIRGEPESVAAGRFSGSARGDDIAVAVITEGTAPGVGVVVVKRNAANPPAFVADAPMAVGGQGSGRPLVAAADLSAPPGRNSAGTSRDLVVGFVDQTSMGRVALLVGKEAGGFNPAGAALPLGTAAPRSLVVADLDGDRAVDLAVSAGTDETNGSIRFFQGKTTAGAIGFQENTNWTPVPGSLRPGSLVAGPFGRPRADASSPVVLSVAGINLVPRDTIAVHVGNGRGAFVQPSVITTDLPPDARLFVKADFHSTTGDNPQQDLAFVNSDDRGQPVLSILLSNGAGGFARPLGVLPIRAGARPLLMAAGSFVAPSTSGKPADIVLLDQQSGGLILRVFNGSGGGRFTASQFELPLPGLVATAIVPARFRGQDKPMDLAIIGGNKVTVLFNDGTGRFDGRREERALPFEAGAVAMSARLRPVGVPDLLIRDAKQNQFIYLVNIGEGRFRGAGDGGIFSNAGSVNQLLLAEVTGDNLDDVVTFDQDMKLRVFQNRATPAGDEGFHRPVESTPLQGAASGFAPGATYTVADFGDRFAGLAASVIAPARDGADATVLAVLKSNGQGVFTAESSMSPIALATATGTGSQPMFKSGIRSTPVVARPEGISGRRIGLNLGGVFRNRVVGNDKADVAIVTVVSTVSVAPNACPGDPLDLSPPPPVCRKPLERDDPIRGLLKGMVDMNDPCCECRTGPPAGRCPGECTPPRDPRIPFCAATREFMSLALYANTCRQ